MKLVALLFALVHVWPTMGHPGCSPAEVAFLSGRLTDAGDWMYVRGMLSELAYNIDYGQVGTRIAFVRWEPTLSEVIELDDYLFDELSSLTYQNGSKPFYKGLNFLWKETLDPDHTRNVARVAVVLVNWNYYDAPVAINSAQRLRDKGVKVIVIGIKGRSGFLYNALNVLTGGDDSLVIHADSREDLVTPSVIGSLSSHICSGCGPAEIAVLMGRLIKGDWLYNRRFIQDLADWVDYGQSRTRIATVRWEPVLTEEISLEDNLYAKLPYLVYRSGSNNFYKGLNFLWKQTLSTSVSRNVARTAIVLVDWNYFDGTVAVNSAQRVRDMGINIIVIGIKGRRSFRYNDLYMLTGDASRVLLVDSVQELSDADFLTQLAQIICYDVKMHDTSSSNYGTTSPPPR